MELEQQLTVAAPRQRVWDLLLDPNVMAGCVPGTQAVEVISDTEYHAEIKVKISFISARFRIRTTIVESRAPDYLRIEGTGEDSSVASAMKQTSELFLTDDGGGGTTVRIKARAEVLGRLGSFGLGIMRTKADRMWDEFGANFAAVAERDGAATAPAVPIQPPSAVAPAAAAADDTLEPPPVPAVSAAIPPAPAGGKQRWWQRIKGHPAAAPLGERRLASDIYVEIHGANGVIKVLWPSSAAGEAARWLKEMT